MQASSQALNLLFDVLWAQKVLAKPDDKEIALPHEKEISGRSGHNITSSNDEENQTDDDSDSRKNNIFVDKLMSWRSNLIPSETAEQGSNLYSPKSCSICLEPYAEGDDICWSKNEKCSHAYHLNCMIDWLMRNDECPLCRENYLEVEEKENEWRATVLSVVGLVYIKYQLIIKIKL